MKNTIDTLSVNFIVSLESNITIVTVRFLSLIN